MRRIAVVGLLAALGCAPATSADDVVALETPTRSAADHASAGRALTRQVLEGDRDAFDPAVRELKLAAEHNRFAKRELARLLNLPLSESDLRYVPLQVSLYEDLLEEERGFQRFVTACFLEALEAARANRGVSAYRRMVELEDRIDARLDAEGEADLHAMAGNYGIEVAARTRLGRRDRLSWSRDHLRRVDEGWDDMSIEARGLVYGVPGTRVVFTFWLAELELMLGNQDEARAAYERVLDHAQEADTPATAEVAGVAQRRLEHVDALAGTDLLPLWPSGHDSCVACHAERGIPSGP